jgi:hypothetical protein
MVEPVLGRGRGRGRFKESTNGKTYLSSVASPASSNESLSPNFSTRDDNSSESGFSSASTSCQSSVVSTPTVTKPKGRGQHLKRDVAPEDPHWTVTNLTQSQFNENIRPKKPDELGTLGEHIKVLANYFPILQFPHKGLVYRYHIQIRNRKNFEIHRQRRR